MSDNITLKPFHVSVVNAINAIPKEVELGRNVVVKNSESKFQTLLSLLENTRVPEGHSNIIDAIEQFSSGFASEPILPMTVKRVKEILLKQKHEYDGM